MMKKRKEKKRGRPQLLLTLTPPLSLPRLSTTTTSKRKKMTMSFTPLSITHGVPLRVLATSIATPMPSVNGAGPPKQAQA
jgi:hypothetical protein